MLIVRTPLRIPFFSGGSDHPSFIRQEGGLAFSATIDKYVYVIIHPNIENQFRFTHDTIQTEPDVTKIKHLITEKTFSYINNLIATNQLIGSDIDHFKPGKFTVVSMNDINHIGTGLGASSAYTVGLVKGLITCLGYHEDIVTEDTIAKMACAIEIDECCYNIGVQDQWAAAVGGVNLFDFRQDMATEIEQFHNMERMKRLARSLVLVNSGELRHMPDITMTNLHSNRFNSLTSKQTENMREGKHLAQRAWDILNSRIEKGNLDHIGEMLNNSWRRKKLTNRSVTNTVIDQLYDHCIENGAIGGKLLGAGSGGFMLFYVPQGKRDDLIAKLPYKERVVDFSFVHEGSKVIYDDRRRNK